MEETFYNLLPSTDYNVSVLSSLNNAQSLASERIVTTGVLKCVTSKNKVYISIFFLDPFDWVVNSGSSWLHVILPDEIVDADGNIVYEEFLLEIYAADEPTLSLDVGLLNSFILTDFKVVFCFCSEINNSSISIEQIC